VKIQVRDAWARLIERSTRLSLRSSAGGRSLYEELFALADADGSSRGAKGEDRRRSIEEAILRHVGAESLAVGRASPKGKMERKR